MQLSNVPEIRPARRLLIAACVLFAGAFVYNLVTVVLAFRHDNSERWLDVARLIPNLVTPLLIWRGYVLLAALAERAAIYKQALEDGLPKLQAAVDRHRHETDDETADPGIGDAAREVTPMRSAEPPRAAPPAPE